MYLGFHTLFFDSASGIKVCTQVCTISLSGTSVTADAGRSSSLCAGSTRYFDQAVRADNLLVRSTPQRQMLSFSFDPLQHVFDRAECSYMNLHAFFIEQTQKPAQLLYAVRAFAIYFSVESSITKHARPFSLA